MTMTRTTVHRLAWADARGAFVADAAEHEVIDALAAGADDQAHACDIANHWMVGVDGQRRITPMSTRALDPYEAATVAAWMLVLSGVPIEDFLAIMRRVEAT